MVPAAAGGGVLRSPMTERQPVMSEAGTERRPPLVTGAPFGGVLLSPVAAIEPAVSAAPGSIIRSPVIYGPPDGGVQRNSAVRRQLAMSATSDGKLFKLVLYFSLNSLRLCKPKNCLLY